MTLEHFQKLVRESKYQEASNFTHAKNLRDFPPHQALVEKQSRYRDAPKAIELLAHHNDWPDWLATELEADVKSWLADLPEHYDDLEAFDILYGEVSSAPYVQEVASRLSPEVELSNPSIDLTDETESTTIPKP